MTTMQGVMEILGRTDVLLVGGGIAAFLVLTWIVRGAPMGQSARPEAAEAPSRTRRDVAVALAVSGFLLVVAGAVVAFRYGIPWYVLPLFCGRRSG